MDDIWNILGIEPSRDEAVIKKAYAQQTRQYHPEENPEMFLRLRKAYQAALAYCDSTGEDFHHQEHENSPEPEHTPEKQLLEKDSIFENQNEDNIWEKEDQQEDIGWQIVAEEQEQESNPYIEHDAHKQFLTLYTGKQRNNPKLWMDYFTSSAFLEVHREPAFTALLLEDVEQQEQDNPPNREFLTWLHIAYQFTSSETANSAVPGGKERQFGLRGSSFEGIESIFRIAAKGPVPRQFRGNECALSISFSEYNFLMRLVEEGSWSDQALTAARSFINDYVLSALKEKCTQSGNEKERHPAGLRLFEDFFKRQTLPEELYRILWECLSLKTATMGRTKLFYGKLREIVLERVPGIEEEEEENFSQLFQDDVIYFSDCRTYPEKEVELTEAFFAREDVQKALRRRRFVEEYLLRIWMNGDRCIPFLEKIRAFYSENTDAPCAASVVALAEGMLQKKEIKRQMEEDQAASVTEECVSFHCRPFFRYWINTGFFLAEDPESGQSLLDYLNWCFPYLPEWSRRFAETGKRETMILGGHVIEVIFHRRHIEYQVDAAPVYRPFLQWTTLVKALHDDRSLFLLLPVTAAAFDQYESVRRELHSRLEATAAPERDRSRMAGFLAGHVCSLPVSESLQAVEELVITRQEVLAVLPMELFAENEEHLYGCSWFPQRGVLLFFEQTATERRSLPRSYYEGIYEENAAVSMARRLLQTLVSPTGFDLSLLQQLPDLVHVQPQYAPAETLEEEEINEEKLKVLIGQYAQGSLIRLQLHWYGGSLVFLRGERGFACLYFDDRWNTYYILLSMPEVYRVVEDGKIHYISFGMGKLPDYGIHQSIASIISRLDKVFGQMGSSQSLAMRVGDQLLWAVGNSGNLERQRYRVIKQKLGGFPAEQVQNYILSKFVIFRYPEQIEKESSDGNSSVMEIGSGNTDVVKLALVEFMQDKLRRLRLSWNPQSEGQAWYPFHIVLLQEDKRYMMVCLRDDIQQAEYYVADVSTYMDVEGKKYPKDHFMGRITPAYLIHSDAKKIRNCLDLIFDDMGDLPAVMGKFAAFASEKPVKARTYEEIRGELIVSE
ncbi:MAG: J domain-containing protein [Lachnospiraceae bacterium]|nr:J domain-containing protein [Lachnospiraceae bacterium]